MRLRRVIQATGSWSGCWTPGQGFIPSEYTAHIGLGCWRALDRQPVPGLKKDGAIDQLDIGSVKGWVKRNRDQQTRCFRAFLEPRRGVPGRRASGGGPGAANFFDFQSIGIRGGDRTGQPTPWLALTYSTIVRSVSSPK